MKPFFVTLLILSVFACGQTEIEDSIVGTWYSDTIPITVRTEPRFMKFDFHDGEGVVRIKVDSNYRVSGTVGNANIQSGEVKTNWLLPVGMTLIAYTIQLELSGPIFQGDPLPNKKVELWVGPFSDTMNVELRYTEKGAQFPMAGFLLEKQRE